MRLKDRVEDMRDLVTIVRKGWDEKKIFVEEDVHDKDLITSYRANSGWQDLLHTLDNYLPEGVGYVGFGENGPVPSSVHKLLIAVEAFLVLIANKEIPLSELESDLTGIIFDNGRQEATVQKIMIMLREKYKLF